MLYSKKFRGSIRRRQDQTALKPRKSYLSNYENLMPRCLCCFRVVVPAFLCSIFGILTQEVVSPVLRTQTLSVLSVDSVEQLQSPYKDPCSKNAPRGLITNQQKA